MRNPVDLSENGSEHASGEKAGARVLSLHHEQTVQIFIPYDMKFDKVKLISISIFSYVCNCFHTLNLSSYQIKSVFHTTYNFFHTHQSFSDLHILFHRTHGRRREANFQDLSKTFSRGGRRIVEDI